jgi:hypothetical protein
MKSKVCFLVILGLLFVFLMGCGGSYGGGGGTTYQTIVGTWNKASSTGDGANLPDQLIFNVSGTGSYSGGALGSGSFTWTYGGTTLVISPQGGTAIVLGAPQVGTVVSPLTLTTTTGGTATYNR